MLCNLYSVNSTLYVGQLTAIRCDERVASKSHRDGKLKQRSPSPPRGDGFGCSLRGGAFRFDRKISFILYQRAFFDGIQPRTHSILVRGPIPFRPRSPRTEGVGSASFSGLAHREGMFCFKILCFPVYFQLCQF
jgi:hypothetical protein